MSFPLYEVNWRLVEIEVDGRTDVRIALLRVSNNLTPFDAACEDPTNKLPMEQRALGRRPEGCRMYDWKHGMEFRKVHLDADILFHWLRMEIKGGK